MTVENKKIDDHIAVGDDYLVQVHTDAAGNYTSTSIDPSNLGIVKAQVTKSGAYSIEMVDADGNINKITHGGEKSASDSQTQTVTGHVDFGVGGGTRTSVTNGTHNESGEAATNAVNGPAINAMKTSQQNLSEGGNGHQVMKGDQAFVVDEGGVHHEVTKDFTVTSKSTIALDATNEFSVKVGGNEGHTAQGMVSFYAASNISFESATSITFKVGDNKITITPDGILIDSKNGKLEIAAENGPVTIEAANKITLKSKQGTKIENQSLTPPLPWDGNLG